MVPDPVRSSSPRGRRRTVLMRFCRNPQTGVDISYKERSPGYSIPPERHSFWEMVYVDRGLLRVSVNGEERALRQGDYTFIPPGIWHAVEPSFDDAPFYVTIHFETNYTELDGVGCLLLRADSESRRLVSQILKERQSGLLGAEELARCYMVELVVKSVRQALAPNPVPNTGTYFQANHEHSLVDRALAWMQEHLHEPQNLNSIARATGVSASHLEHVFKKTGQRPVMSCLLQLRVQRAKQLLLESNRNVSQIAELTGFSSVHVFSRCFKKTVSFSPSQYAKTIQLAASRGGQGASRPTTTQPDAGLMPLR